MSNVIREEEEILEALVGEISRLAKEEAEKIVRDAEEEARKIIREAEEKAKRLRESKLEQARKIIRQRLSREYSLKRLELMKQFVKEKYELLENIMNDAVEEVLKIVRSKNETYREALKRLAVESSLNINSENIILRVVKEDVEILKEVLPEILKEVKEKKGRVDLEISNEPMDAIGGVFAESGDGREYFNNTIDVRINKVKEELLPSLLSEIG